jgi:rhodanese-related sulfurtransferase
VGELPSLQAVHKEESALPDGVVFLTINVEDTAQATKAFMSQNGYTMPALLGKGNNVLASYNIVHKPTSFFIDRQGIIRSFRLGPFVDGRDIKSFFSDTSVSTPVTDTSPPGSIRFIQAPEVAQMILAGEGLPLGTPLDFVMVDCRSPAGFEEFSLAGAVPIFPPVPGYPKTDAQAVMQLQKLPFNKPLIFYDQTSAKGGDAWILAQRLLDFNIGYDPKLVRVLQGGLTGWADMGYPLSANGCND